MNESILPNPDFDGFVEWVKNQYTDNRWSEVYTRGNSVTVWSGKYPAFSRFQQDIRPRLHEHGLVISETRTKVPKTIDEEMEKVHWIRAIPVAQAVAASHGLLCDRTVCTNLVKDGGSDYCEACTPAMERVEA